MSFPSSISSAKYSIVKISAIPSYCYSEIPRILSDYAFIFETFYSKDTNVNGFTNIDIVPINTLNLYNTHVEAASKFEYKGGNLIINEFAEITEENSSYGKQYVAVLKNQVSKDKKYVSDKNILLCEDNGDGEKRLDNIPLVQLGPEFESKIEYYNEKERLNNIRDIKVHLLGLQHHFKNEEEKTVIEQFSKLVEKQMSLQKDKENKSFDNYLNILKSRR